jgi:hypothetical protein
VRTAARPHGNIKFTRACTSKYSIKFRQDIVISKYTRYCRAFRCIQCALQSSALTALQELKDQFNVSSTHLFKGVGLRHRIEVVEHEGDALVSQHRGVVQVRCMKNTSGILDAQRAEHFTFANPLETLNAILLDITSRCEVRKMSGQYFCMSLRTRSAVTNNSIATSTATSR